MEAKCNFYLKEPGADSETLIYLFCHFGGKRLKYSLGQKVHPRYWNEKTDNVRKSHPEYYGINLFLEKVERIANEIVRQSIGSNATLTVDEFREKLKVELNGKPVIAELLPIDLLDVYMKVRKSMLKTATIKKYVTLSKHLNEFQKLYKFPLTLDSINSVRFYETYCAFLIDEKGHLNSSIAKDIKLIKTFLAWAVKSGYTTNNGFKVFKSKETRTDNVIVLSEDELSKLEGFDFSEFPHLDAVRDSFYLQCVTGLRHSDVRRIEPENVKEGNLTLWVQKTRQHLEIPLINSAQRIFEKYKFKVPSISNQKTNLHLKTIGRMVGIDEMVMTTSYSGVNEIRVTKEKYKFICTHTARRTFITLSILKGMPIPLIKEITGHTSDREFSKYMKFSQNDKIREMSKAWDSKKLKVV